MKSRYGPNEKEVLALLRSVDSLTEDQLRAVSNEYAKAGFPTPTRVMRAARRAGREQQVANAAWDMTKAVNITSLIRGFVDEEDVRRAAWAANNAGLGVATEDLIGDDDYTIHDFGVLVDAWFKGLAA